MRNSGVEVEVKLTAQAGDKSVWAELLQQVFLHLIFIKFLAAAVWTVKFYSFTDFGAMFLKFSKLKHSFVLRTFAIVTFEFEISNLQLYNPVNGLKAMLSSARWTSHRQMNGVVAHHLVPLVNAFLASQFLAAATFNSCICNKTHTNGTLQLLNQQFSH